MFRMPNERTNERNEQKRAHTHTYKNTEREKKKKKRMTFESKQSHYKYRHILTTQIDGKQIVVNAFFFSFSG